jgi:hypothetical protein
MSLPVRSISVDFSLLSDFTDKDLEREFPNRDGAWHGQTTAILQTMESDRLDLNLNWAEQPASYVCPCCQRTKPQLAKKTRAGVILCRLDEHHDHLTDYIQSEIRAELGSDWVRQVAENAGHIGHACSELVRRFTPSILCIDCNAADGAAKGRLPEIHRFFSFSPAEIARFIAITPNREHRVDLEAARGVWMEVRAEFEDRLALADVLRSRLAAGRLSQSVGNVPPRGSSQSLQLRPLYFIHNQVGRTPGAFGAVQADLSAFEARSVSRAGVASRPPRPRKAADVAPTDADVESHGGSGALRYWQGVVPGWRCIACSRSRREILRHSRKGKKRWSGRLWKHQEFRITDLPDSGPFIDGHETHLLCGDCVDVERGVKQRQPELSDTLSFLQINEIAAVITPYINGTHNVDWQEAARLASANRSLRPEIDRYWRLYSDAISCWNRFADLRAALGPKRGYETLLDRYRPDRADGDEEDLHGHVDWLLEVAGEHFSRPPIIGFAEADTPD